jgi:hypothetical protein
LQSARALDRRKRRHTGDGALPNTPLGRTNSDDFLHIANGSFLREAALHAWHLGGSARTREALSPNINRSIGLVEGECAYKGILMLKTAKGGEQSRFHGDVRTDGRDASVELGETRAAGDERRPVRSRAAGNFFVGFDSFFLECATRADFHSILSPWGNRN